MNIVEKTNLIIEYGKENTTSEPNEKTEEILLDILTGYTHEELMYVTDKAREITNRNFGKSVYIRGLIEFTNICKNDCLYCGIRCSNGKVQRYRLTKEEILECCQNGYKLGMKTFVLQGGEDLFYKDDFYVELIREIKDRYKDCAVTLSVGEKEYMSYKLYKDAGADRYLLRHESATKEHYCKLHPESMSFDNRMRCLENLKALGFQTGCGIMTGSPFQTAENLVKDLIFMHNFNPQMVGVGPFIPCDNTPFEECKQGNPDDTIMMIALTRLLLPKALIPATTALSSTEKDGRIRGLNAGCNVVMINISPREDRSKYNLYNNKSVTAFDDAESISVIKKEIENAGFVFSNQRGDYRN